MLVTHFIQTGPNQWTVAGRGAPLDADAPVELFLGNAGTAMRPLTAALCAGKGEVSHLCICMTPRDSRWKLSLTDVYLSSTVNSLS